MTYIIPSNLFSALFHLYNFKSERLFTFAWISECVYLASLLGWRSEHLFIIFSFSPRLQKGSFEFQFNVRERNKKGCCLCEKWYGLKFPLQIERICLYFHPTFFRYFPLFDLFLSLFLSRALESFTFICFRRWLHTTQIRNVIQIRRFVWNFFILWLLYTFSLDSFFISAHFFTPQILAATVKCCRK